MERNNVLLKITDLRQYFPVGKKKGLYVKANDGISLNIYEMCIRDSLYRVEISPGDTPNDTKGAIP